MLTLLELTVKCIVQADDMPVGMLMAVHIIVSLVAVHITSFSFLCR